MKYLFLLLSFCLFAESQKPVKREKRPSMTTSVIVPCASRHFEYLFELLQCYERQTCRPNEIVISLSEIDLIHEGPIDALERFPWSFQLKIVKHLERRSAGENRNIACSHATGEIILCQDADDVPHPQRVEIVKYIFEKYRVDHLIHKWDLKEEFLSRKYQLSKIPILSFTKYSDLLARLSYLHNGNICLSSKVAKKMRWESNFIADKDVEFNKEIYKKFKHNIVIPIELMWYRNDLSSFREGSYTNRNK